jgi:prephenate dehydrogenase
MKVAVVGLGLMGGSFAMAIKESKFVSKVYGYDLNKKHKKKALKLELVSEICSKEELLEMDVIVLAIPVDGIISMLNDLKKVNKNCTIIDFGSTKSKIVHHCPKSIRKNLVASHPMTGTEKSGPTACIKELYKDKIMVICDGLDSGNFQRGVAEKLFDFVGSKVVYMESHDHDLHAAFISHLPHIISFSLANSVMNQENPSAILTLAAGGFKDMSRIAKSNPQMWKDIFRQNKENVLKSLEQFQRQIDMSKDILISEDWDSLESWMIDANRLHDIL